MRALREARHSCGPEAARSSGSRGSGGDDRAGPPLVVRPRAAGPRAEWWTVEVLGELRGPERARHALALALAEREARGVEIVQLTVELRGRGAAVAPDFESSAELLELGRTRGLAVALRTAVVLGSAEVDRLDALSARIELALGDVDLPVQRALVGEGADPAARLLWWAQSLRARGRPVLGSVGPLVPELHDGAGRARAERLVAYLAGAGLGAVEFELAGPARGLLERLHRVLPEPAWQALAAGAGFTAAEAYGPVERLGRPRWDRLRLRQLAATFAGLAAARGLGCAPRGQAALGEARAGAPSQATLFPAASRLARAG